MYLLVSGGRLTNADARLFSRLVAHRSPPVDYVLWAASRAANRSLRWLAIVGFLAARCVGANQRSPAAARLPAEAVIASLLFDGSLRPRDRLEPGVGDGLAALDR